jgi:hypothetical protein
MVVVMGLVSLIGCGSSSPDPTRVGAAPLMHLPPVRAIKESDSGSLVATGDDLEPVHWRVIGSPSKHVMNIISERGYCAGEGAPRFEAVRISERGINVYISPYVRRQHPTGEVVCRGLGGFQRGAVELQQDVDDVRLYDATTAPPSLRWSR